MTPDPIAPPLHELELGGLVFARDPDGGGVLIREAGVKPSTATRIPAKLWARIVAHVSARGETHASRADARVLHEISDPATPGELARSLKGR